MARITGAKEYVARLRRLGGSGPGGGDLVKEIGAALFEAGSQIETDAAISITNGSVSGKNHVPSAPGQPPNADKHDLDRSIETNQIEPLRVQVSANAAHAVPLEFGTSKMAERPFMRPALAKNRKAVIEGVRDAVNRIIRRR